MRARILLMTAVASLLPALGLVGQVDAATFTVTRTDDPEPDACLPADCSLREAVMAANGEAGSTITVPAGLYTLTIPGTDADTYDERIGDLDIRVAMTINGAGASITIVRQTQVDRVFDNSFRVSPPSATPALLIARMTVRDGAGNPRGGCIRNRGKLTIDSVTVTGCTSSDMGGGIASEAFVGSAELTVIRSTITGNSVKASGALTGFAGGVGGDASQFYTTNDVRILESEISNNTAAFGGGVGSTARDALRFLSYSYLRISNTRLVGNSALHGGAAYFTGSQRSVSGSISHSTVRDNRARFEGGGVLNGSASTGIYDSTFTGNVAGVGCVGAECDGASAGGAGNIGALVVFNSTFSGNACGSGQVSGGAIDSRSGRLWIANSTVTGNSCARGAGVAYPDSSSTEVFLKNTIVANNTASDPTGGDCSGAIPSQGYNLVGSVTGCAFAPATGDLIGSDPELGPLRNNGGPTSTHALSATSPARNAGDPNGCASWPGMLLPSDQRGYARPQEGRCDIGAFEYGIDARVVYRLRHSAIGAYLFTLHSSERDSALWQFGYVYEGICCNWLGREANDSAPLYRLFSSTVGQYLFTIFPGERDAAASHFGYVFEGTAAYCHPDSGPDRTPWFRLRYGNKHLYTIYPGERDAAVANYGYVYEGVACYLPVP